MKKRALTLLLAFAMLLTAGACKSSGPNWDENTLVLASVVSNPAFSQETLDEFQEAHPDITLEIRDYSDAEGKKRLLTEMMAGYIPDILCVGGLPFQQMAQRGYLEDLWPYIENDPDIGRESLMEPPLKAAEVDGKLYTVFRTVTINTLAGPKSLVGDRMSWTVEDLLEAFSKMPEDATITDYYATKDMMFAELFRMNLDGYIDWEAGTASFDNESFRNSLEFIRSFPESSDWTASDAQVAELAYRRKNGLQLLAMLGMYNPSWVPEYDRWFGEEVSFVGYPMGDGSIGSSFRPSARLAMSSCCRRKEAAWDLLRTTLLPRYNFRSMMTAIKDWVTIGFPVNRADYEVMKQVYMSKNGPSGYDENGEKRPPVTEEQFARFEALYNRIEKLNFCDEEVFDLVWESADPYFAGDKTLDETIDMIQRRVTLYVNESR